MEISLFFQQTELKDYTSSFPKNKEGSGFDELHESMNKLFSQLKESRINREAQLMLFKGMIENLTTGILLISKEDEILLCNPSLQKMLATPEEKSWKRFQTRNAKICKTLLKLKVEEKVIIWLNNRNTRSQQLLITKRHFHINQSDYQFYSFQDIHQELEKKEIESWQKLIQILTHEIMNSVSPIVSLSSTLQLLLNQSKTEGNYVKIESQNFKDLLLSAETIEHRSEGLMKFISEYSKLSRMPEPRVREFNFSGLLSELRLLVETKLKDKRVHWAENIPHKNFKIKADQNLLSQVLLNLIQNSLESFSEENKNPEIWVDIEIQNLFVQISLSDNGDGIDEEIQNDIFLPFFTTKENGNGIGLSLSKNIILAHGGDLTFIPKKMGSTFCIELPI